MNYLFQLRAQNDLNTPYCEMPKLKYARWRNKEVRNLIFVIEQARNKMHFMYSNIEPDFKTILLLCSFNQTLYIFFPFYLISIHFEAATKEITKLTPVQNS